MVESVDAEEPDREEVVMVSEETGSDPVVPEPGTAHSPQEALALARDAARQTARQAKQEARRERAAIRAARRDRIVEAPREPKASIGQRLRRVTSRGSTDAGRTDPASSGLPGGRRRVISALAGVLGAVGLVCSVVLAVGALLVALGSVDGAFYDTAARICDALVGPLRDAFTFSGTNADMKQSLVAWGSGSIAYLLVGLVVQSLLRSAVDD